MVKYIHLLFIGLLLACNPQKAENPKSYFCRHELEKFFSGPDSLPVIKYTDIDSLGRVVNLIASTSSDIYFPEIKYFRITFNLDSLTQFILKAGVRVTTFSPVFTDKPIVDIAVNRAGVILAEGELADTTTITNLAAKHLLNFGKDPNLSDYPTKAAFRLKWQEGIDAEYFSHCIKAILTGNLQAMDSLSLRKYGKPICELDSVEINPILKEMDFKLLLEYVSSDIKPNFHLPQRKRKYEN